MKLAYREYGQGRPLIILHGLFGQSDNWNMLAKSFAEKGFRVFTLDQRNHGLSPHSDTWTYEAMADDLKEFIEDHQLVDPVLLGHSMGAKTVMFFDEKYPGVSSTLVIADMSARAYPRHHNDVLDALHAVNFDTVSNRKEAEAVMSAYINDFGTKQFLLKNIYWKDNNSRMDWRFNLKTISENYDNVSIEVPKAVSAARTLVIRGERSNYVNASDLEEFELRFPGYTLVTIPDAAHWVHAEKPKEFFEAVLEFITA